MKTSTITLRPTLDQDEKGNIVVSAIATIDGVDVPLGLSMSLRKHHTQLATRLCDAIRAGKAYPNPRLAKNVHGERYVRVDLNVTGRLLDSQLKALGF